jgi:hypothetical protein
MNTAARPSSPFQRETHERCQMFLLLTEALPWDDLEVNLTGPLTSGTRRYSSGGLTEI